jgi:F-type H+-transporting ATPase subunit alpha
MKKIAGPLRLNLAQFRELEAFAEFGSELDATSLAQLERGRRVVEVLKQGQYDPLPVADQVVAIFAVTEGFMDGVDVSDVHRFEGELREYMRSRHGHLLDTIADSGQMDEDAMRSAIDGFASTWTGNGHTAAEEAAARRSEDHAAQAMREGQHSRPVGEA